MVLGFSIPFPNSSISCYVTSICACEHRTYYVLDHFTQLASSHSQINYIWISLYGRTPVGRDKKASCI